MRFFSQSFLASALAKGQAVLASDQYKILVPVISLSYALPALGHSLIYDAKWAIYEA
jgi:hypothetical protein